MTVWEEGCFEDNWGCVLWMFESHQNVAVGAERCRTTLCHPGVQSHALDVSSVLLLFARRPEEFGRRAEVRWNGPAGGTDASCNAATTCTAAAASRNASVITIAPFEGAGVAAHTVCRRAAGQRFQGQQGAWVLRRAGQDRSAWGRGRRGRWWRGAGGAAIPARWDRLRLDAHVGACVYSQHGALRYMSHRPENRVTLDKERGRETMEDKRKDEKNRHD